MPQFFRPYFNPLAKISLLGAPVFLIALGAAAWVAVRAPAWSGIHVSVEQPIPFSHEFHAGRLKLDCRYCHGTVEHSAAAGMPATQVCMHCHTHVWTGLRSIQTVHASYDTGTPLVWFRVHDLPDFARFDHSIHVQKGIGCVTCHGRVDQMPVIMKMQTLRMDWCLDCHRHPERHVRPREEIFNMAWEPRADPSQIRELAQRMKLEPVPQQAGELNLALVDRYRVRSSTNCTACHQ